jgi:hypothetical protein
VAGVIQRLRRLLPFANSDPYWDNFVNRPIVDQRNMRLEMIRQAPGGGVWATKMDVHDEAAMADHMTQLAQFWWADLVGIVATNPEMIEPEHPSYEKPEGESEGEKLEGVEASEELARQYPLTIVCAIRRDYDESAKGMGGRFSEQRLAVCNFNLRSYIREIGYAAAFATPKSAAKLAASAGLGTLDSRGRFTTKRFGDRVVLGDVVITDLPMKVLETEA